MDGCPVTVVIIKVEQYVCKENNIYIYIYIYVLISKKKIILKKLLYAKRALGRPKITKRRKQNNKEEINYKGESKGTKGENY